MQAASSPNRCTTGVSMVQLIVGLLAFVDRTKEKDRSECFFRANRTENEKTPKHRENGLPVLFFHYLCPNERIFLLKKELVYWEIGSTQRRTNEEGERERENTQF